MSSTYEGHIVNVRLCYILEYTVKINSGEATTALSCCPDQEITSMSNL